MTPRTDAPLLGRLLGLLQRCPMVLDFCLAALLALIGFPSWPGASTESAAQAWYGAIVGVSCAALALRRTAPRSALAVVGACMTLHAIVLPAGVTVFATLVCTVAAYTTQTQLSSPWRWAYLAWIYVGAAAMPLLTGHVGADGALGLGTRAAVAGSAWVLLTAAALAGAIRRDRRDRVRFALDRLRLLEAQQDAERRLAASEERTRIAREVHDVLGHSLNTIAMQAEGIRTLLGQDPDRADAALASVARLSRDAVDEVRELVDVLRDEDAPAPLRPTPSIAAIRELVDTHRAAGASIALRIEEGLETGADAAGFAVYRIVQESLTNAVRHAPGTTILVDVHGGGEIIEVTVANSPPIRPTGENAQTPGHGLVGMRERARALGGFFEAGSDPLTGGWRVTAGFPRSAS